MHKKFLIRMGVLAGFLWASLAWGAATPKEKKETKPATPQVSQNQVSQNKPVDFSKIDYSQIEWRTNEQMKALIVKETGLPPTLSAGVSTAIKPDHPIVTASPLFDTAGYTTYDLAGNHRISRQIALGVFNYTHVDWTQVLDTARIGDATTLREVYYSAWFNDGVKTASSIRVSGGDENTRSGFTAMAVTEDGRAVLCYHHVISVGIQNPGTYVAVEGTPSDGDFPGEVNAPDSAGDMCDVGIWPSVATHSTAAPESAIIHAVAVEGTGGCGNSGFAYSRGRETSPGTFSFSPAVVVDSSDDISITAVASRKSGKVALLYSRQKDFGGLARDADILYVESQNYGRDWIGGSFGTLHNVTNYQPGDPVRASGVLGGVYDEEDSLHIVWVAPLYNNGAVGSECVIYHWSKATGIDQVADGTYSFPDAALQGRSQSYNLMDPHIAVHDGTGHLPIVSSTNTTPIVVTATAHGFADGNTVTISGHLVNTAANGDWIISGVTANTFTLNGSVGNGVGGATGRVTNRKNYLYVSFNQFGPGTTDAGANGVVNGEIYINASTTDGNTWGNPQNITNSSTPGCTTKCDSDINPTCAERANDTIHISYLNDKSVGLILGGQGNPTLNPVYYYKYPAYNPPAFKGIAATPSVFEDPVASPTLANIIDTSFEIHNVGNQTLRIDSVREAENSLWLEIITTSFPDSIPEGGSPKAVQVRFTGTGLATGTYVDTILVYNNSDNKPRMGIPVHLVVTNCGYFGKKHIIASVGDLKFKVGSTSNLTDQDLANGFYLSSVNENLLFDGGGVMATTISGDTLTLLDINAVTKVHALSDIDTQTVTFADSVTFAQAKSQQRPAKEGRYLRIGPIEVAMFYPDASVNCLWPGPWFKYWNRQSWYIQSGKAKPIVSSTNATPIVVKVIGHGYTTGDSVLIRGHAVNTAANGNWVITVLTDSTFQLGGSIGNGTGGATGTAYNINKDQQTKPRAVLWFTKIYKADPPCWWPLCESNILTGNIYAGTALDWDLPSDTGGVINTYGNNDTLKMVWQRGDGPEGSKILCATVAMVDTSVHIGNPNGFWSAKVHRNAEFFPDDPRVIYRTIADSGFNPRDTVIDSLALTPVDRHTQFGAVCFPASSTDSINFVMALVVTDSGGYDGLKKNVENARLDMKLPLPGGCLYKAGDANKTNTLNLSDIILLVNHVFKGAAAPDPKCLGDCNNTNTINLSDIIILVNHVFKGAPKPAADLDGPCCL